MTEMKGFSVRGSSEAAYLETMHPLKSMSPRSPNPANTYVDADSPTHDPPRADVDERESDETDDDDDEWEIDIGSHAKSNHNAMPMMNGLSPRSETPSVTLTHPSIPMPMSTGHSMQSMAPPQQTQLQKYGAAYQQTHQTSPFVRNTSSRQVSYHCAPGPPTLAPATSRPVLSVQSSQSGVYSTGHGGHGGHGLAMQRTPSVPQPAFYVPGPHSVPPAAGSSEMLSASQSGVPRRKDSDIDTLARTELSSVTATSMSQKNDLSEASSSESYSGEESVPEPMAQRIERKEKHEAQGTNATMVFHAVPMLDRDGDEDVEQEMETMQ